MKKYLILIDVDGTVVATGQNSMDKRLPKLFERIKNCGHIVAIVSGRAVSAILAIEGIEKARYVCGLMGSVAIDLQTNQKIIKPKCMGVADVKGLIEDVNNLGLKWTYKDESMEKSYFNDSEIIKKYSPTIISKIEVLNDIENSNVFQILVDGKIPQSVINKYTAFDFIEMPGDYYDIVPMGASKATIVEHLKKLYPNHIPVAIGDSGNDIDMFKNCSLKIAMGQSKEQLKQISTHITKSLEEGGVFYAIENILKIWNKIIMRRKDIIN